MIGEVIWSAAICYGRRHGWTCAVLNGALFWNALYWLARRYDPICDGASGVTV